MSVTEKILLILTPGFPANEDDTTCIPPQQTFVKALKENNPSLKIIVVAFQYPFFKANYSFFGVKVISLDGRNKAKLARVITWIKAWNTLLKINRENEVIGILSFWLGECALIGKWFAKYHDIKQFTWLLGQDAKKGNIYYRLVQPTSSSLIALSDFISEEFNKNYSKLPAHTIPVGIDTSKFSQEVFERNIDIIGVGSLIPLKRYDLFIHIIKEITGHMPGIRCVIIGKGSEKQNLLNSIQREGLQENITLMDELPHKEVLHVMQRSKIFLHTSTYEGFGTVLAEALYAGAHVISFTRPMHKSYQHYYGIQNKTEMIDKTLELLRNDQLNHDRVLMYSIDEIAEMMMKLFSR